MTSNAGRNVRNIWIDKGLHERIKVLSNVYRRSIRDTVEICLEYGIPHIEEDIRNNKILSKQTNSNVEERTFEEVSRK